MNHLKLFEEFNWKLNKNKTLIKEIYDILKNDNDEDMYELLEEIYKKSHFNAAQTSIEILKNGEFSPHPNMNTKINSPKEIRKILSGIKAKYFKALIIAEDSE